MFSTVQSPYSRSVVHAIQCMKEATVTILPLLIARLHSNHYINQWRNRWGAGGKVPPETSDGEISADLPGKKRQGKGVKIEKKRRKIVKGKVENWKFKDGR